MMNEEGKVQEERAVQVNDFAVDTQKEGRKRTPRRLKVLLGLSLVVTGFAALGCLWSLPWMIKAREWEEAGAVAFAGRILFVFTILISFAGLICIAKDLHAGRMFSGTLVRCVLLLGVIYTAASVWIPRLSGYHSSGYEILSSDAFVLIDGTILLPGLLLLVLGSLIREGARMQKEQEEIL